MAISTRQAGSIVDCPTCGEKTLVPQEDLFAPPPVAEPSAPTESQAQSNVEPQAADVAAIPVDNPSDIEQSFHDEHFVEGGMDASGEEAVEDSYVPSDIADEDDGQPLTIRRHKAGDEDMDLTPMVDVTFQLLIFFMVSASFSLQKTIEVPTPDPDQKGATQQVQTMDDLQGTSILVKIDAANAVSIDEEPLADVTRLADALRDKMRREQKTEVLLTAHPQSLHRMVIAVIDAANEIGVQKIRMSSQKKTD